MSEQNELEAAPLMPDPASGDTEAMAAEAEDMDTDALASLEAVTEPELQEIDSFSNASDIPQMSEQPELEAAPLDARSRSGDTEAVEAAMPNDAAQGQPVFDIAGEDAPMPALDMPALDSQAIAETAEETPPPADLRATQLTDLQPMGDLTDEDLEAAFYEADTALEPTVDSQALLETEALQTEFDTQIETSTAIEEEETAAFVTRRIIGVPA